MVYFTKYDSPLGELLLISDGAALTGLDLEPKNLPTGIHKEDLSVFAQTKEWLDDYFAGTPRAVDVPLAPQGTAFQQRVWGSLQRIDYGTTCTYGELAKELGCPSAQAIGQAVGHNPIGIIIPCHRVIGAKGGLTGYAWGIERKRLLLEYEEKRSAGKQHDIRGIHI